jgi:addiction module HigA family antidote
MKALKMKNPPHPGFSVRVDCLEPHSLSVTEGAKVLGVSRSALSHLVNENADLSWDMAIRLAKAFGSTPESWMRLQFQYDASQVGERAKKSK